MANGRQPYNRGGHAGDTDLSSFLFSGISCELLLKSLKPSYLAGWAEVLTTLLAVLEHMFFSGRNHLPAHRRAPLFASLTVE